MLSALIEWPVRRVYNKVTATPAGLVLDLVHDRFPGFRNHAVQQTFAWNKPTLALSRELAWHT